MPGPMRNHNRSQTTVEDDDIVAMMGMTSASVLRYNNMLADQTCLLSSATQIPANLAAVTEPNGDIYLRYADGEEAEFAVIGVICGECLVAPSTFSKNVFPHFYRWVRLSASDDPHFAAATDAREVLYNLLALKAKDIRPRQLFRIGNMECFRPSAEMLTVLQVNSNAAAADIPPFYDADPFEAAIRQGHGSLGFTTDNEVLYFKDKTEADGQVIRSEAGPNSVDIGQVAQVTVRFRALRQPKGPFVFRELLKSIVVLDDGISTALARQLSEKHARPKKAKRKPKTYPVYRQSGQKGGLADEPMGE